MASNDHEFPNKNFRTFIMATKIANSVASANTFACCVVSERVTNDYSLRIEDSPQFAAESFNIKALDINPVLRILVNAVLAAWIL